MQPPTQPEPKETPSMMKYSVMKRRMSDNSIVSPAVNRQPHSHQMNRQVTRHLPSAYSSTHAKTLMSHHSRNQLRGQRNSGRTPAYTHREMLLTVRLRPTSTRTSERRSQQTTRPTALDTLCSPAANHQSTTTHRQPLISSSTLPHF